MKRSYIIFLISFLATAGIMGGYFYYINKPSIESPATAADSATDAPQKAADAFHALVSIIPGMKKTVVPIHISLVVINEQLLDHISLQVIRQHLEKHK